MFVWRRLIKIYSVVALVIVCAIAAVLSGFAWQSKAAAEYSASPWVTEPIRVLSQASAFPEYLFTGACNGGSVRSIHSLSDSRDYTACVFGELGQVRVARYATSQGIYEYAVSFVADVGFYKVKGMCEGVPRCYYTPGTDMLMSRVSIANSLVTSVRFYKDVTKQLVRKVNSSPVYTYYEFVPSISSIPVMMGNRVAPIEAAAFSKNGKWAAVELRSFGVAIIDTTTFQAQRVRAPGGSYDMERDPAVELTVSNDGRFLAVSGLQGALELYEVDPFCGDPVVESMGNYFNSSVTPCRAASMDPSVLFPGFSHAFYPAFDTSGERLQVSIRFRDGRYERAVIGPSSLTPSMVPYVALGDSFTSGEGETDDKQYLPSTNSAPHVCHVSGRSYPFLLAAAWQVSAESVACSGAQTSDVVGDTEYKGQGDRLVQSSNTPENIHDQQLRALEVFQQGIARQGEFVAHYFPQLVTIGLGGNDAGLMDKLRTCVGTDTCEWAENTQKRAATAAEIGEVYRRLRGTIAHLKEASPASQFVVIGYPQIISSNVSCGGLVGVLLNRTERVFMRESIAYLNAVVAAAARAEGAKYVDVSSALDGHELCQSGAAAINAVRFGDDIAPLQKIPILKLIGSESFHPTPLGHTLVATEIQSHYATFAATLEVIDSQETVLPAPGPYWQGATNTEAVAVAADTDAKDTDTASRRQIHLPLDETVHHSLETVSIVLEKGMTAPLSPIRAELHSEAQLLGEFISDTDGALKATVALPDGVSEGYHTVHLLATGASGELVDIYRVIAVGGEDKAGQEGANANANANANAGTNTGDNTKNTTISTPLVVKDTSNSDDANPGRMVLSGSGGTSTGMGQAGVLGAISSADSSNGGAGGPGAAALLGVLVHAGGAFGEFMRRFGLELVYVAALLIAVIAIVLIVLCRRRLKK